MKGALKRPSTAVKRNVPPVPLAYRDRAPSLGSPGSL